MRLKTTFLLLIWGLSLTAAEQTTWNGQISDDMCGADHTGMGNKLSAHDCVLMCAKGGSKFVLVSGGKVYDIANQSLADLNAHAGHDVKVTGNLSADGKTITVSKVAMVKK